MGKIYLTTVFFYLLYTGTSFAQGNFNSLATGNWSAPSSWTLVSGTDADGVPDSDDNVTIIGANNITVDVSSTCNDFTISVATATITISAGNTLNAVGALSITRGTVAGATGTLACSGALSTVTLGNTTGGPTINSIVNFDSPSLYFTRTTFNSAVTMVKSAGSLVVNQCRGGNTFNSTFTFTNAAGDDTGSSGDFYFGSNAADPTDVFVGKTIIKLTGYGRIRIPSAGSATFNGVASFISNGIGAGSHDRIQISRISPAVTTFNDSVYVSANSATSDLQVAYDPGTTVIFNKPLTVNNTNVASAAAFFIGYNGDVSLNDNVILNCIATSGNVSFGGSGATAGAGTVTLASGKRMMVGASGFSVGNLYIYNLTQMGGTGQTIALSGTSSITVGASGAGCIFPGNFTTTSSTATIRYNNFGGSLSNTTTTGGATLTSNTVSLNLFVTTTTSTTLTSNSIVGVTNIISTTSTTQTSNIFGGAYACNSATINLYTNTFNNTATLVNNGSGGGVWGGNTFNSTLSLTNTSTGGSIQLSQSPSADIFTNTVTVSNTNSGNVVLSRVYDTNYPENINISNTGSGGIYFGNAGGSSTLANGKILNVGTFNNGLLNLKEFIQIGGTAQNIVTTGSADVTLGNANNSACSFDADLTISCASTVTIDTSTFKNNLTVTGAQVTFTDNNVNTVGGTCSLTKTGTSDDINGGNTFNRAVTLTNSCATTGFFRFSDLRAADVFNSTLTVISAGSDGVRLSRTYNTTYNDNIVLNNTGTGSIAFGTNGGSSTLINTKTITCGTYNNGTLTLRKFYQIGGTAQNIVTTASGAVTFGGANSTQCIFDANITVDCASTLIVDSVIFKANVIITGKSSTYTDNIFNSVSGTTSLTKTYGSTAVNVCGNNQFKQNATITNTTGGGGALRFGATSGPDVFSGNLTINNTGTGTVSMAYSLTGNTIAGNLSVSNSTTGIIRFGETAASNATTIVGTTTAASGSYTNGSLIFNYFTQSGTGANSLLLTNSANTLTVSNSTFNGNVTSTCPGTTSITTSSLNRTVDITTSALLTTTSNYNATSGTTTIVKNGNSNDDTNGQNTFTGVTSLTLTSGANGGRIRFGSTLAGDVFGNNLTLTNQGTATISMAYNQTGNTIAGNLVMTSSAAGTTRFGEAAPASNTTTIAGTTTATTGAFTNGTLILNRYTQSGTGANTLGLTGSANTLTVTNSTFNGNMTTTIGTGAAATTTFTNSNFNRTNDVNTVAMSFLTNTFNTTSGTTLITRTGANNDDTNGQNTFNGATTITSTAASGGRLRMASSTGADAFNSTLAINNLSTSAATLSFSYSQASNTYSGNITIVNTGTGITRFGEAATAGTLNSALSAAIISTSGNFTDGSLFLRCFNQTNAAAASSLLLTSNATLSIVRSTFTGNLTTTCNQTTTLTTNNNFNGTNDFTSVGFILGGAAVAGNHNNFGGPVSFTRTGGGNDGTNGNNVYNAASTFTNSGTGGYWRLSNNAADDYNASATFIQTGTSVLAPAYNTNNTFAGDISTIGTTNVITFASAGGTVTIDGTGAQVFRGSNTYQPIVENLTMLNTGGAGVGLTLNVTVNIGTAATFTTGYIFSDPISVSTNILNFASASTVSGASNSSYVDGTVRKTGTQAFVFPTGKTSITGPKYRYIAMSATGGAGKLATDHFTAEYFNIQPNVLYDVTLKDPTIIDLSNYEYWILNKTNGVAAVSTSVTLSWDNPVSNVIAPLALTDVVVARWNTAMWKDHGASGGTATGSIAAGGSGSVTSSAAITTFSPFTLGFKKAKPLPVELLSFDAKPENNKTVNLTWSTASEKNNDRFEIEKSTDGINFERISEVKGKGTTSTISNYATYDVQPYEGLNYYRLRQVDFDGKYVYSEIKSVRFSNNIVNGEEFTSYPNPITTGESLNISAKGLLSEKSILVILNDVNGKEVYSKIVLSDTNGNLQTAIDIESKLAPGIYFVVAASDDKIYNQKIVIK